MRKVLRCLDKAQSACNVYPSRELCKELFHARAEANDNVKFLAPLRKWVEQLQIVRTTVLCLRSSPYRAYDIIDLERLVATTTRPQDSSCWCREVCNVSSTIPAISRVCPSSS